MKINSIRLENYRNYINEYIEFDPKLNIITGENAQGKTNLIEAIAYLSNGRAFRSYRDAPVIKMNEAAGYITGVISAQGRDITIEARIFTPAIGRKQLLINGNKLKKQSELSGHFGTVLFCPDDIILLRDSSQGRRRFLDVAICQLSPAYSAALEKYESLLKGKSKILKYKDENPAALENIHEYNIAMAKEASIIIMARAKYLQRLSKVTSEIHGELSSGKEALSLIYKTVTGVDPFADRESVYIKLREHQDSHYRAELESCSCLSGPHKDDFECLLSELPIKTYGSQGQNRSAVVSLKLAEREILARDMGEYPVLLLDDVLSELDQSRQDFILSKLDTGQVFVTCCENHPISQEGFGKTIRISGGRVCI